MKAATWKDITSRFVLGTSTAFLNSGTKDISDLFVAGKLLYIGFKYVTKPQEVNGLARQWFVQTFAIKSTATLDNTIALNLTDQGSAGFRIIDENAAVASPVGTFIPYDKVPARASISTTRITLYGNQFLDPISALLNPANPLFNPLNPIFDPDRPEYIPTEVKLNFVPYNPSSLYNDPLSEHWAISKVINAVDGIDLGI